MTTTTTRATSTVSTVDAAAQASIGAAARELHLPTVRTEAAPLAEIALRERQSHLGYLAEVLAAEAQKYGCWRRAWDLLAPPDPGAFRPLLPLRKGHVALMMASGLLNSCVIEGEGRRLLVRGQVRKDVVEYSERDDKGVKHIERDVIKTEVTALDLDTGELIEVA